IGAGSSGTIIANRLTENPEWKVLLLEAGEEDSVITEIPVICDEFQLTGYNWGYSMEKEPNQCLGLKDQRCPWPRGKVLGGTSTINYMIYTRGQRRDYDEWAEMGNPGWSYDDVLPLFMKMERNLIPEYQNSKYHNNNGTLSVERVPHKSPLMDAFLEAGQMKGYSVIDYNNPDENSQGFSRIQANMHGGRRINGANAFLRPIRKRPNLHIALKSRVTRVLIDPETMTAKAVEMTRNRQWRVVRARKEVILSAGAINSPHILMHSGIGPADHLAQVGYKALKDLKVGYNMMEHVASAGLTFFINESLTITLDGVSTPNAFFSYMRGQGPITVPGGVEGLAYIHTKMNDDAYGRPDMEFIFAGAAICSDAGATIRKGMGITDESYYSQFDRGHQCNAFTIWPMILSPKSRGRILLRDNNPFHWPIMKHDYFESEHDLLTCIEGLKLAVELAESPAFARFNATLNPRPVRGCENVTFRSDAYYECLLRHITTTLHHQSGTCKMGPATDPDAVVDPELRVHGVRNLRVVDASIIPRLPRAHTNAVAYMIGEKAAELIKKAWPSQSPPAPGPLPSPYSGPYYRWRLPGEPLPVSGASWTI
ncbi:glucose dehydrogenase [FAD, quinone]-like, partial [Frankliniella occidentalis]|uniref:Glucose dehydrogenase [FAD, quinone]-like n=1 Tax=Frankliniella occidentalis TaxID=133901 RepID=A0A9C6XBK0_FRAOC